MARLQVGQKSWLASKSSKFFCWSDGIIRIKSPQPCLKSHTIILPKFWPSSNAGDAWTGYQSVGLPSLCDNPAQAVIPIRQLADFSE